MYLILGENIQKRMDSKVKISICDNKELNSCVLLNVILVTTEYLEN